LVGVFWRGFVDYGLADYIFFAGPCAEVEQFAALAAEGEVGVRVGVCGLLANWTVVFHTFAQLVTAGLQGLKPLKKRNG